VEVLISFSGSFYASQINLQGLIKPPQIGLPLVICGDFLEPLVHDLYCRGFLVEGCNLLYSWLLFCGGFKHSFISIHLFDSKYLKSLFFTFFVGVNTLLNLILYCKGFNLSRLYYLFCGFTAIFFMRYSNLLKIVICL